jgi:hypothetical protein
VLAVLELGNGAALDVELPEGEAELLGAIGALLIAGTSVGIGEDEPVAVPVTLYDVCIAVTMESSRGC